MTSPVRVRFCPSPTGTPHVGLVRTALFNYAYARHTGGTFVFRIEDTDAARDSEESYAAILDALRWLGLDWDEGPEVGGPYGPYRQSQRREIHLDVVAKLLEAGEAYEAYSTPEEVEARHKAAGRDPKLGYDNFDRDLTDEQRAAYRAEGRSPVVRLRMPDEDLTWDDLVRGETTIKAGTVPDFALTRGSGDPLYTLVNPVDDAMMKITHVLRGEDLLSSTPRQIALYRALERIGIADGVPRFGHLPFVMGEGNRKLSKRDPQSSLFHHRDRGFLPEGLLNYLALLGWGYSGDTDVFTLGQMVEAFDVADVNSNPARFDEKKAEAINAEHIRMLEPAEFTQRLGAYLVDAGHLDDAAVTAPAFGALAELIQTRIQVLGDAWGLIKFFYVDDDEFVVDEASAAKNLGADASPVLDAAITAL
ncbi:MAG: glutamate--tRNA ligase, partial [Gordonia sp. (in: high G+C Gram-positive bacteria)]